MRKARCGPARGLDRLGDGPARGQPARGQGTLELIPAQCYQRMESSTSGTGHLGNLSLLNAINIYRG